MELTISGLEVTRLGVLNSRSRDEHFSPLPHGSVPSEDQQPQFNARVARYGATVSRDGSQPSTSDSSDSRFSKSSKDGVFAQPRTGDFKPHRLNKVVLSRKYVYASAGIGPTTFHESGAGLQSHLLQVLFLETPTPRHEWVHLSGTPLVAAFWHSGT